MATEQHTSPKIAEHYEGAAKAQKTPPKTELEMVEARTSDAYRQAAKWGGKQYAETVIVHGLPFAMS